MRPLGVLVGVLRRGDTTVTGAGAMMGVALPRLFWTVGRWILEAFTVDDDDAESLTFDFGPDAVRFQTAGVS